MPERKVGQGRIAGKRRAVARDRRRIELEAEQSQAMLAEECAAFCYKPDDDPPTEAQANI